MKTIIRLDWLFQTIMIAIILLVMIVEPQDAWLVAGMLLFCQHISAIVILIMSHGRGPRRWIFLIGSFLWWRTSKVVYLIGSGWLKSTFDVVGIAVPVTFMVCYWLLTTCNLYPSNIKYHKGKFLPHTSF